MKLVKTLQVVDENFCSSPDFEILCVNDVWYDVNLEAVDRDEYYEKLNRVREADPRKVDLVPFSEPEAERFVYYDLGNFGYKDSKGKVIILPQFPTARAFSYGFAAVCTACDASANYPLPGRWNFVNARGEIQFGEDFAFARDFNRFNVALVRGTQGTDFLVNKKQIKVPNSEFPYCRALCDEYPETHGNYRYFVYSYKDADAEHDFAGGGNEDVLFGLYDCFDCTVLFPPKFRRVEVVTDGVFRVWDAKNVCRLIDAKGNDLANEDGAPFDPADFELRGLGKYVVKWDRPAGVVKILE